MTPDDADAYARPSESVRNEATLFDLHRDELLDLASIDVLTRTEPSSLVAPALTDVLEAHELELTENLKTRLALLDGELNFVGADLERRTTLVRRLEENYTLRTRLHTALDETGAELTRLGIELLSRRHHAEEERLQQELDRLTEVPAPAPAATAAESEVADEPPPQTPLAELRQQRQEMLNAETPTFAREAQLRAYWITRTVAGFLLWLGYASVVATGAVLAMLMSGAKAFEFQPLVAGTRVLVTSVFPSLPLWTRLFIALGLLVALARIVVFVFVRTDKLLRKHWDWGNDKKVRGDATAQMAPQALTPRTYARFIATLPFAFTVGVLIVILALAPASTDQNGGTAALTSIFPTVGYSFIGITIAFLSTAIFVMYFIHLLRPRAEGVPVLRRGWEFAVPPLLLITALAVTAFRSDVPATRWLPWAAFMLLSSLALAGGLVFHGLFKDAKVARDRIRKLDKRIERLTGVPADEDDDENETEASPQVSERRRLERSLRHYRLRTFSLRAGDRGTSAAPSDGAGIAPAILSGDLVTDFRAVDLVVAPELVQNIQARRAVHARLVRELEELSRAIAGLEEALSFVAMNQLVRRQHLLTAIRIALPSHQEERRQHARIAKRLLELRVAATDSATQAIAPLFETAREQAIASVPGEAK
jgi:hypothetical protein